MSRLQDGNAAGDIEFSWGPKKRLGGKKLDIQYYESFTYDGVEYFLYDDVYMWCEGQSEPPIGKLVKIFETRNLKKMVKVVWYFRPAEVQVWLRSTTTVKNELLLGSGEGKGLFNLNPLETICGKCNVVCTSKDKRNPQATMEEVKMADFFFYRTFDVEHCKLSERFPDMIAGVELEHFFNQRKDLELTENSKEIPGNSNSSSKSVTDEAFSVVKDEHFGGSNFTNEKVLKFPAATMGRQTCSSASISDSQTLKKRKHQNIETEKGMGTKTYNPLTELKRKPQSESSKWFKQQPWEDRMQKAHETGSLVLLENLDPCIISSEVEDIVWDAFKKTVSAKMIQSSNLSSPYYGQALVIFKSKDEADFVILELNTRCLLLGDVSFHRPVIGSRPSLKKPGNPLVFFGHHIIDNMKQKQRMEMRNAVSTSHYSQPNTIEFEMAVEWRALQNRSKLWWDALYKKQAKEIAALRTLLK